MYLTHPIYFRMGCHPPTGAPPPPLANSHPIPTQQRRSGGHPQGVGLPNSRDKAHTTTNWTLQPCIACHLTQSTPSTTHLEAPKDLIWERDLICRIAEESSLQPHTPAVFHGRTVRTCPLTSEVGHHLHPFEPKCGVPDENASIYASMVLAITCHHPHLANLRGHVQYTSNRLHKAWRC